MPYLCGAWCCHHQELAEALPCPSVPLYAPYLSACCWCRRVHQIKTRDELIIKPLTAQEAGDARDALAKALYSGKTTR